MPALSSEMLHATCVCINGRAVLLEGESGAGKSDLALRLIDRGGVLVSDDYTLLRRTGTQLFAFAPPTTAGQLEVRGLGIVTVPYVEDVPAVLMIGMRDAVVRMPERETRVVAGIVLPWMSLDPRTASAPIKVELALKALDAA